MTNKDKIKEFISNDFNKDNNYNEIVKMIEAEKMKSKNNLWKWSLVPICFVIIIGGFLFMNNRTNNLLEPNQKKQDNVELNINYLDFSKDDLYVTETAKSDIDVRKIITTNSTTQYKENIDSLDTLENGIAIPKDLDIFNIYSVYTRKDKRSEYNILNSYVYHYSNEDDNNYKNIRISFSNTNKPVRDYYFSHENSKETIINNVKLTIFKYNHIYIAEFAYDGYYFDIETNSISEKELLDLLISIIE